MPGVRLSRSRATSVEFARCWGDPPGAARGETLPENLPQRVLPCSQRQQGECPTRQKVWVNMSACSVKPAVAWKLS